MKKIITMSVFVFLTSLFAGLFFSTGLSAENSSYLSSLFLSGISSSEVGFWKALLSSATSNFLLVILMLPAVLTRYLCPLPLLLMGYKSFAIGFCSGLVFLSAPADAISISLLKIIPQNLFFIPAFLALSVILFLRSFGELSKTNRPSREKKGLQKALYLSFSGIAAGCIVESLCHLISL